MIRDIFQQPWAFLNCFFTHLLRLKTIRDMEYGYIATASSHISCVLNWSGTSAKQRGSMRTASMHVSFVIRWSGTRCYPTWNSHILFILLDLGESQILWTKKKTICTGNFKVAIYWCKKTMKNNNSIIETIPWIRPFIDIKTMSTHQKLVILIKKTMKTYSKAVILSL